MSVGLIVYAVAFVATFIQLVLMMSSREDAYDRAAWAEYHTLSTHLKIWAGIFFCELLIGFAFISGYNSWL